MLIIDWSSDVCSSDLIATELLDRLFQFVADFGFAAVVRIAPLLRHVLTLQAKALQRFGNDRIARPVFANLRLQRLDRLQGMTIDDGRADVTDDVIRRRNGGV